MGERATPAPGLSRGQWAVAAAVLVFAVVVALAGRDLVLADVEFPEPEGDPPNIIMLVTDDQASYDFKRRYMPQTFASLVDHGTNFNAQIVPTPQCCPWRAAWLTGQYGHNNGVLSNRPGYPSLVEPDNVLPVWLQRAGYNTVQIGKWLNGYEDAVADPREPPVGWTDWQASIVEGYYDYKLSDNGDVTRYGDKPSDYHTTVVHERALDALDEYLPQDRPLYLSLDYWAPHKGFGKVKGRCDRAALPAKQDLNAFKDEPLPRTKAFNERDVSDKPEVIRRLAPLGEADTAVPVRKKLANFTCRLGSLQAVDRSVAEIMRELEASGELENTVVIFTSDNGFFLGQHRIASGKTWGYEEGIRVPLAVRAGSQVTGGRPQPRSLDEIVAAIDIAPTILDWAGAAEPCATDEDCRVLDGRSWAPLLDERPDMWPRDRGIALEAHETGPASRRFPCKYQGIRTPDRVLILHEELGDTETRKCEPYKDYEYYDLKKDPLQLDNGWARSGDRQRQRRLATRLEQLADCAGIEGRDPRPPSGHWCE